MKNIALFFAVLGVCSIANGGTTIIEGLPERVNTFAGPVTLSFDIVSNGQLDNDSLYVWINSDDFPAEGSQSCGGAVNHVVPGEVYCRDDYRRDIIFILYPNTPWLPFIWRDCVWADISIPKAVPDVIQGNIVSNLELTIPEGFEGMLKVKVMSENDSRIEDVVTIEVYTECIPNAPEYEIQFVQWAVMGMPACWCNDYGAPHTQGNQCYGDAAGDTHSRGYIVYTQDLKRLVDSWKAKISDPNFDPCADFDHRAHPGRGYRVYTGDLAILSTNWKATELPGDCPKTDAEIGLPG